MLSSWLLRNDQVAPYADQATALAEQIGRDDLAARATAALAYAEVSRAHYPFARTLFLGSARRLGGVHGLVMAYAPHASYLVGEYEEAIDLARQAAESNKSAGSTFGTLVSMSHLGLSLAAMGEYAEAARVFDEAQAFGRKYESRALLARCLSMSSAFRVDTFDFEKAEAVSLEAREIALAAGWHPPVLSSGLDLAFNYARRHDDAKAESILNDVAQQAAVTPGSHEWLWKVRIAQARGEIALERREFETAQNFSQTVIDLSQEGGGGKYVALGSWVHALALHGCVPNPSSHRGASARPTVGSQAPRSRALPPDLHRAP